MRDITILMSACGSPTMPGGLSCFRNNGERLIRVIGVDMVDEPTARHMLDGFYKVPPVTSPDYFDIILNICKKENVDIYFPNISAEVGAMKIYKDKFETIGVKVSISNLDSIEIGNDKLRTYQTLQKAGIAVPEFYAVYCLEDFAEGCKVLGFPDKAVCLKIVSGSGSRCVRIIDNKKSRYDIFANSKPNTFFTSYEDMLRVLNSVETIAPMMLMPYLPGNEYTVDLLAENGKVLYMVGRDNVKSLMSIAQESILLKDDIAYDVAEKLIALLKYDGNMGIDFMKDEQGIPVITDINPRITATIALPAAGGLNLPYFRIKQLLGEKLPPVDIRYGTKIKRYYLETFCDKEGNPVKYTCTGSHT